MIDIFNGDSQDIRERLIWVIKLHTGKPARYKILEDEFGIQARKWQNVCNKAQQPSLEMLTALSKAYPYLTDWMVTGTNKTVLQVNPADEDWKLKATSWIEPKDVSESSNFRNRVIDTATVVWGQSAIEMESGSGIDKAIWNQLLSEEIEPTIDMVKALCKEGAKYALWMMNGSADTYMQISPRDKWQHKLLRALGRDIDKQPN